MSVRAAGPERARARSCWWRRGRYPRWGAVDFGRWRRTSAADGDGVRQRTVRGGRRWPGTAEDGRARPGTAREDTDLDSRFKDFNIEELKLQGGFRKT
jgi:hypothetical protein